MFLQKTGSKHTRTEGVFEVNKIKEKYPRLLEKPFYQWSEAELEQLEENATSKKSSLQEYIASENAILVKDSLEREIVYKYNFQNQLESLSNLGDGTETQTISYNYTKAGRIESVKNQFDGKTFYKYTDFGTPSVMKNSYGTETLENGKKVIFKDGETQETNGKLTQNLDDFGQLTEEINSFGIKQNYFYDKSGDFTSKIDGNNVQRTFTKRVNSLGYEEITEYSDGTKKY